MLQTCDDLREHDVFVNFNYPTVHKVVIISRAGRRKGGGNATCPKIQQNY